MPLDPRARRFLDLLAATNPPSALSLSVAERRAALEQLLKFSGPQEAVAQVDEFEIAGPAGALPVRVYTPLGRTEESLPGVVYFHGGGLVAGSIATHDPIARALANSSGCRLVSVGYRLAPEWRFPAAVEDSIAAVRHVHAHGAEIGVDGSRLVVAGDSAGATLAAVACQVLARADDLQPALQVLLCPILDYSGVSASRRDLAAGYLVDEETLAHDLRHYIPPGTVASDPRISPLRSSDLRGVARAAIHSAEFDPLRDEAKAYADRLQAEGGTASYTCHAGMIHLFYGLAGVIPYARAAFGLVGAEIRAAVQ
jgi:acetyl esterase